LTHIFLLLVTVGLGHGVYRKLYALFGGQRAETFENPCSKPSVDLFPHKCTYAKVIDLRNMVLWSIGFIANRYRIPHQISLCPLLYSGFVYVGGCGYMS